MRTYSALIFNDQQLMAFLQDIPAGDSLSHLVQILSTQPEPLVCAYAQQIDAQLVDSHIIGHSTRHTIYDGQIAHEGSLVVVSCFEHTWLTSTCVELSDNPISSANRIRDELTLSQDSQLIISFSQHISSLDFNLYRALGELTQVPISGGVAANVDEHEEWVLFGTQTYQKCSVSVALHSKRLKVWRGAFSEWTPVGGPLRVTDADGCRLKSLDYQPAYRIFQTRLAEGRTLGLEQMLSFPLKSSSGEISCARELYSDGSIELDKPIPIGDEVRICYNHPSLTLEQVRHDVSQLAEKNPESIFIYNCESRLEFVEGVSEIKLFDKFEASCGSYCLGEFYRSDRQQTLHHSMTYVALSEDDSRRAITLQGEDEFSVSPLFHLIRHSIDELNQIRQGVEQKLAKQTEALIASYRVDKHTGLQNRVALQEKLIRLKGNEHIITFKLSNFHQVNEKYGYQVADELIRDLTEHITANIENRHGSDLVKHLYYIGPAEWAIVFASDETSEQIRQEFSTFAEQLEHINFEPYGLPEIDYLSVSITAGIASRADFPEVQGEELLLKSIDARRMGKARNTHMFNAKACSLSAAEHQDRLDLMGVVSRAILNKRILTYSQPIFAAHSRKQVSQECLVRIEDGGNIIAPGRFLPIIEGTHLYTRLSRHMLTSTVEFMANRDDSFSINLSPQDMLSDKTLYLLEQSVAEMNDPYRLGIEVLESEQIKDFGRMAEICSHFKKLGVRLMVDDFGSGYSNLDEIIRLEPDIIKLDGSLIKTIDKDEKQRQITAQLVKLCQVLNAKTVAEFVHNGEVCNIAESLGVDYLQGFYLAEPKRLF
ncbi:EAL domain-containing protein [Vibrio brasiliensis]|jgi:EAL domain-containing protein (putative c-di-GMP-specific phosphodiesterase class I)/GGDEF domain-containing protein|uniref:bifunctional diguanylate cyclase/phosphodiesterase n=1 Tax=Vibrio brasiliensis TaxID=170652 RepID=UPI001EFD8380|nr:EAL domain-containing protein [Vibrio brasiliensis]MCG9784991.1 EAL domain-containing protein [Vibrio brasiliensis]